MAWRFHEHLLRGELDNTVRGRVTGRLWLAGITEPMTLDLRGDCAPDLATHGAAPLPPDELTDETLSAKLWELLHNLACRGFYVLHTDHLSDRALYETLWQRGLREEAILPGRSRTGGYFYDPIGSYGPADLEIFHHYYESEKDRAKHLAEYPNEQISARETPPFSRDWRLPKGPF